MNFVNKANENKKQRPLSPESHAVNKYNKIGNQTVPDYSSPCPFSTTTKSADDAAGAGCDSCCPCSSASCRCRLWCISRLFLRCRCVRCRWWLLYGRSCITTSSAPPSSSFISAGASSAFSPIANNCGRTLPRESLELQRELQQLPLELLDDDDADADEEGEEPLIVLILLNELSLSLSSSCTVVVVSDGGGCTWEGGTLICAFNAGIKQTRGVVSG